MARRTTIVDRAISGLVVIAAEAVVAIAAIVLALVVAAIVMVFV